MAHITQSDGDDHGCAQGFVALIRQSVAGLFIVAAFQTAA
jgi:hypothetical protein